MMLWGEEQEKKSAEQIRQLSATPNSPKRGANLHRDPSCCISGDCDLGKSHLLSTRNWSPIPLDLRPRDML